jgi:hypothetical protein
MVAAYVVAFAGVVLLVDESFTSIVRFYGPALVLLLVAALRQAIRGRSAAWALIAVGLGLSVAAAVLQQAETSGLDSADQTLSHEYGHAWSMYYAYLVQQDSTLTGYLQARGLAGDSRVDSSYAWSRREMIAEDYRQLLGSPSAASAPQTNRDIPPAAAVPGLKDYLLGAFSGGTATGTTTTSPSPSPSPSGS